MTGVAAYAGTCLTVADKAPHPNAAVVFTNWLLTEEGQRLFADGYNYPPRRIGVPFKASDQFAVVLPGEKTFETDEAFYLEGKKTAHFAKEIFGPSLGK